MDRSFQKLISEMERSLFDAFRACKTRQSYAKNRIWGVNYTAKNVSIILDACSVKRQHFTRATNTLCEHPLWFRMGLSCSGPTMTDWTHPCGRHVRQHLQWCLADHRTTDRYGMIALIWRGLSLMKTNPLIIYRPLQLLLLKLLLLLLFKSNFWSRFPIFKVFFKKKFW